MSQDPTDQKTCDVCQQPFDSEQELQTHQNDAHGLDESDERQSNYDIEQDKPNYRRIG